MTSKWNGGGTYARPCASAWASGNVIRMMPEKTLASILMLVAAATLLPGCKALSQRYSMPKVQAISLMPGNLEQGGLAFLTPSTVTGQEEDKQPLALVFSATLASMRPAVRALSLADTLSAVNRSGLSNAYKHMYQDYRDTGLFDPGLLRQIGDAVGTRYAAQIKMAGFSQITKDRFGVFGLSIVYTQIARVRLFLQIWDMQTGAVAWEGVEELSSSIETLAEKPITLQATLHEAAGDLIKQLP